jgi:osmotically-inducible protein OsmY
MIGAIVECPAEVTAGYQACAEDLAGMVMARLRRSGQPFLWSVRCEVTAGVVILLGAVPTFHLKQMAQELAVHTAGVVQFENRLEVPEPRLDDAADNE